MSTGPSPQNKFKWVSKLNFLYIVIFTIQFNRAAVITTLNRFFKLSAKVPFCNTLKKPVGQKNSSTLNPFCGYGLPQRVSFQVPFPRNTSGKIPLLPFQYIVEQILLKLLSTLFGS